MFFNLVSKQVKAPGDNSMAESAVASRCLGREPWTALVDERNLLDLRPQSDVESWMAERWPHAMAFAAAQVGGMRETPQPMTEEALPPLCRFRRAQ